MAFTVITDPFAARVVALDAVWLDADGETAVVDLAPTVPEAVEAQGSWLWVRADVEPGGANGVNFQFGDALHPTKRLEVGAVDHFTMFVPLCKGRFNITATGQDSVVNVIIYPQAVQ